MKTAQTTIKLSKNAVGILNKIKIHPRQSYEEVILEAIKAGKIPKMTAKISRMNGKVMTSIKARTETVRILSRMKIHPRQSYEEVILSLISK